MPLRWAGGGEVLEDGSHIGTFLREIATEMG